MRRGHGGNSLVSPIEMPARIFSPESLRLGRAQLENTVGCINLTTSVPTLATTLSNVAGRLSLMPTTTTDDLF